MNPSTVALEGNDRSDGAGEYLTVVGNHEDRLARFAYATLQRELGGHVEEIVRFVQQQHVGVGPQQHVEHKLLAFAAREGLRRSIGKLNRAEATIRRQDTVPLRLKLIPPTPTSRRSLRQARYQRRDRHRSPDDARTQRPARPRRRNASRRERENSSRTVCASLSTPTSWAMYASDPPWVASPSAASQLAGKDLHQRRLARLPLVPTRPAWQSRRDAERDIREHSRSPPGWA